MFDAVKVKNNLFKLKLVPVFEPDIPSVLKL